MSEAPPTPADDGARRIYVLWGVGLGLLAALALVCWLVAGPVLQVRRLADLHRQGRLSESQVVAQLGGQERAVSKLLLHLRVALKIGAHRYTSDVLDVLCCCEVPANSPHASNWLMVKTLRADALQFCYHSGPLPPSSEEMARKGAQTERYLRWADWFEGKSPPPQPPSNPRPD